MTYQDHGCPLCGSRSHNRSDCPWAREQLDEAPASDSAADTAARLVNDISSPAKGSLQ